MVIERAAAIYDIHGNLPALEAVLREVARLEVEVMLVGGDVAAGPMPVETIERLMALRPNARFVRGNADRELVLAYDHPAEMAAADPSDRARQAIAWVASRLERRHRDFLESFERDASFEIEGLGKVLFCHGSPRMDDEIITAATPGPQLRDLLAGVKQSLVVCGHTHIQFDRCVDGIRLVNGGSVGVPYEREAAAYWLLLGPGVSPQRTDYDVDAAVAKIRTTGYPAAEGMIRHLIDPVDPASAIAFFERQAGRGA